MQHHAVRFSDFKDTTFRKTSQGDLQFFFVCAIIFYKGIDYQICAIVLGVHFAQTSERCFMNIYFITFGCKVNLYETAAMTEMLLKEGFAVTADKSSADIFVINSCTVTHESDMKLGQTVRRLRREYPGTVIVLTGCYPQAYPEKAEEERADIIIGTKNRSSLGELIKKFLSEREPVKGVVPYTGHEEFEALSVSRVEGHTRGFMKIQDGCNCFCSYCIIPYSRGRIRSRPLWDIEAESRRLAENGIKEIVLTGINLGFYGAAEGVDIADAAEAAGRAEVIERIRLGSLEPERITEDILIRLAKLPKLCPSFHYSLQSGCDRTLAAMNRRYTTDDYRKLTELTRRLFPGCGITTDIMTGFPGETEEDHKRSAEFVREMCFSDIHVFPYSPREGTRAAALPDQIPQSVKKRRAAEMTEIGRQMRSEYLQGMTGQTLPVLFEREGADGIPHGYTPNYVHVKILTKNSEKSLRNSIFYVTIDIIGEDCCKGHIVSAAEACRSLK